MKKTDNELYGVELNLQKRRLRLYSVTEHELNQIAQGSNADIWYSIAVSCLFAIITIVDANNFSQEVSLKAISLIVLCFIGGCFSAFIGWKRRKKSSDTLKEIKG
jgi:hypothetical protein